MSHTFFKVRSDLNLHRGKGNADFTGVYCFGFQRQEQDEELWEGAISYRFRLEDPRLGRFFSVDPLLKKFPWNSNYAFSENKVISGLELEGLETIFFGDQKVDFTGMPMLQVEKELERLDDKHYGNLRADEIQAYMKPGEIWQVRNVWQSGVCTGTIMAKYNSEEDRKKDNRSYQSDVRRSKSQAFWNAVENADWAQEGREGLDAYCEGVDNTGKLASTFGKTMGLKNLELFGSYFSSFSDISQVAADYETLPKELANEKLAIRIAFKVGGEMMEKIISKYANDLTQNGVSIGVDVGLDVVKSKVLEVVEKKYYKEHTAKDDNNK
jgi:hypothetical protein